MGEVDVEMERRAYMHTSVRSTVAGAVGHAIGEG
jgi:hypothetical protein